MSEKTETRTFATDDAMSVITGRLVSDRRIDAVYEILNWMTGQACYTHQLTRIAKAARKVILAHRPDFGVAIAEATYVTPDNWRDFRAKWIQRYGAEITLPKFPPEQNPHRDPIAEAIDLVGADKVIVVDGAKKPIDGSPLLRQAQDEGAGMTEGEEA